MTPQLPPVPSSKKGSNGCLMVLGVFAALALVACLVGGVFAWRTAQNPEVKKAMATAGKGLSLLTKSSSAAGAKEVKALGCQQAFVFDRAEMGSLISDFVDAGTDLDDVGGVLVVCQARSAREQPGCDLIATTYAKAASPTAEFTVSATAGSVSSCGGTYDASGARVSKVVAPAAP
jgi:hypothetical protein